MIDIVLNRAQSFTSPEGRLYFIWSQDLCMLEQCQLSGIIFEVSFKSENVGVSLELLDKKEKGGVKRRDRRTFGS